MPRPRRARNTGKKEKTPRRQGNTLRMMSEPREPELKIRGNHAQEPNRSDKETEK